MGGVTEGQIGAGTLVLAAGTLGTASSPQRVTAAEGSGFADIGLSMWQYLRLREDGWSDAGLRQVLDDHGGHLAEIQAILGFERTGPMDAPGLPGQAPHRTLASSCRPRRCFSAATAHHSGSRIP